ncbi:MAG: DUF2938 domain-containing protein [Turneriella sp.]|mgnify:CR=1 FL=1
MMNVSEIVARSVAIGLGATLAMDMWRLALQKFFGVNSLDLALLGRWVGHLFRGRFTHRPIGKSEQISGETALGWLSHYAIGLTFAGLLPVIWGSDWLAAPSLFPALAVGIGTVLAPWLIMQPAMGLGIAAANAPVPGAVRLRNLAIHTVYGLGLYLSAFAVQWLGSKAGWI